MRIIPKPLMTATIRDAIADLRNQGGEPHAIELTRGELARLESEKAPEFRMAFNRWPYFDNIEIKVAE